MIFEGESQNSRDNIYLGNFVMEGIMPMPKGQAQIDVTFAIDGNRILTVIAEDKSGTLQSK